MGEKLAIDFGTTNTVIASWTGNYGAPEIVDLPNISARLPDGLAFVPSLLYVNDGQKGTTMVGQAVRAARLDEQAGNRLFRNFKRGIVGTAANDRIIDGKAWRDVDAGSRFLEEIVRAIRDRGSEGQPVQAQDIDALVLTAPVVSFDGYVAWLSSAMSLLDAEHVHVVDESTAAALGYGASEPGALALVFDFGGGTLDLSLVQLPESREKAGGILQVIRRDGGGSHAARVIAKAGCTLGGSDADRWLFNAVLAQNHLTPDDLGDGSAALLAECEKAKIALSTAEAVTLHFQVGRHAYSFGISRGELEQLLETNGMYTALRHTIEKVMHTAQQSGIFKEDVSHILLVGGMSFMRSVQALLRDIFRDSTVRADKPFTAVAEGALRIATGSGLRDYLAHSYALRIFDPETGKNRYEEIIPAGTAYATVKPIEITLSASRKHQDKIDLVFGGIEEEALSSLDVRYVDGQVGFVAKANSDTQQIFPLGTLQVPLAPGGRGEGQRIKVILQIDDQRHLWASVVDLYTKRHILREQLITPLPDAAAATGNEPSLIDAGRKTGERQLSLRGLGSILATLPPTAVSPEAARAMLYSHSFYVRLSAGQLLARRGDRTARSILEEVLLNGTVPSRASAARHLYGFTWFSVEVLVQKALSDPDARVREAAIYALCDMRSVPAYRCIAGALQNEADGVRAAAAFGLRDCQDPEAVPALEAVMLALDFDVRVKGLEALGANGTPQARRAILAALHSDPDIDVIYAATLSLLEVARESGIAEIAAFITTAQWLRREAALRGFFHVSNYLKLDLLASPALNILFDALESALQDDLPAARLAAIWPLAWIRHPRANELLREAYQQEPDAKTRERIAFVATSLGADVVDDPLPAPVIP